MQGGQPGHPVHIGGFMWSTIKKIYARFCNLELVVAAICLATTVGIITFAAIARTFGFPQNWALDIALWLFSWSVFIGADTALRADKMVNVDLLIKILPKKIQKLFQLIIYLIILAVLLMFVIYGFKLSYLTRYRSFQGIPQMSYTWVTLCIPISSVFMTITTCIKIVKLFRPVENAEKKEVEA